MFYNYINRILFFLYQPVNADIRIHSQPYQLQMLYLGRQNYLEGIGIPSKPEDPESRFIYALVYDQYGKIVHGNLNYTIDGWKHWRTTPMRLIYGIQANGTWRGEIPTYVMPYTVLYNASFKDDLNYSVTKSGPYYPGNENIIRNGQGYNVTDRYVLVGSQLDSPIPGKYDNFTAIVSDDGRKIENVTLSIYKLYDGKWVKDRALQPVKMVKENRNEIHGHWNYLANIVIPNLPHTKLQFHSTIYDSKRGHVNSANHIITIMGSSTPTSNEPGLNTISVTKMFISNVGISNQTANIQIKLHGPKINSEYSTTPYNQIKNTIGKAQNLKIPLIDIVNNNTNTKSEEKEDIPGSFHNLTRSINSIGFGSFDAMIGSDKSSGIGLKSYTASLSGDPLAFPLDHYSVDLIIEIPFKHVHIQRDVKGVGTGELYKSGWNPPDPEIASCSNIHSNIMNFILTPRLEMTRSAIIPL